MKIDVEDLSPVKKSLSVEAEPEEVARETEAVVRRFAHEVRVPGFRPGKVPVDVVRRRFAREIREDVRDRLVNRLWREATREKGLSPVGDPVLEELKDEEGSPFRMRTTFEVLPVFEVKGFRGVAVREREQPVTDADVDEAIEGLRQATARFVSEDGRAAEAGDLVVADVHESPDGEEVKTRERAVLEVGSADNPPAFNERLLGATPGADVTVEVAYAADHAVERLAGRTVRYALHVHEVKRRDVPALDDDFARDVGDFENVAALRERVRTDLGERRRAEARRAVRQSVLDKVLLENPIPLPESLMDEEIQHRLEDVVRAMMMHGVDPRKAEIDWKDLRERQVEPARKTVHARLVLDAVARAEGIAVPDDELDARIRAEAAKLGESADALRAKLQKSGGLEALHIQLVREKSLDFLTSVANIQRAE